MTTLNQPEPMALDDPTQRALLLYATRYALGRRSYVVREITDLLKQHWRSLWAGDRQVIQRDIEEARDRRQLGDACDAIAWLQILELETDFNE